MKPRKPPRRRTQDHYQDATGQLWVPTRKGWRKKKPRPRRLPAVRPDLLTR